jgi:hypothetical protein
VLDGLSPKDLTDLGPWGLLILVVAIVYLALVSGRLVPRKSHEREIKILTDQIDKAEKRADTWQTASQTWQLTAQEAVENREEQLEQGRTLIKLLSSVPRGQSRRGGS